jgi:hypothetical protein
MKKSIRTSLIISLFVLGFVVSAQAQNLIRKSAEFRNFGGFADESFTDAGVPGISIYTKAVATGIGENILYVTISATGDTHGGAASWFSCSVDTGSGPVFCNPGSGGAAGAPGGWIALNKLPAATTATNCDDGSGGTGDCHDNSITYQWCTVLPAAFVATGGAATVNLRMASSNPSAVAGADTVFIEAAHFYIDATKGGTPTCVGGST